MISLSFPSRLPKKHWLVNITDHERGRAGASEGANEDSSVPFRGTARPPCGHETVRSDGDASVSLPATDKNLKCLDFGIDQTPERVISVVCKSAYAPLFAPRPHLSLPVPLVNCEPMACLGWGQLVLGPPRLVSKYERLSEVIVPKRPRNATTRRIRCVCRFVLQLRSLSSWRACRLPSRRRPGHATRTSRDLLRGWSPSCRSSGSKSRTSK